MHRVPDRICPEPGAALTESAGNSITWGRACAKFAHIRLPSFAFVPVREAIELRGLAATEVTYRKEVPMRTLILLSIVAVVLAIGFRVKNTFIPGSSGDSAASVAKAMATSKPLWPHEIHVNYENMKELPARETKEPF
jgi:hypothetical protein